MQKTLPVTESIGLSDEAMSALQTTLRCPSLSVKVDAAWATGHQPDATAGKSDLSARAMTNSPTQTRSRIREALVNELKTRGASLHAADEARLLDLSHPPRLAHHPISISHCPIAGGFCVSEDVLSLGFDLEDLSRIKASVVARISDPNELQAAPSAALLWLAKEASYKALLGPDQPRVMAMIKISEWRSLPVPQGIESFWSFTADLLATDGSKRQIAGQGTTLCISALGFGFFVSPLN